MQGEVSITIGAPVGRVYALVSDVTRMGDWSPECVKAEWVDGATGPVPGAKFKGHNRQGRVIRWTTTAEVTAVDPGREFAFQTKDTKWRYVFAPEGAGTRVTESFETTHYGKAMQLVAPERKRQPALVEGMRRTLERIKAAAEG